MVDEPFEVLDVGATARNESYIVSSATGGLASAESNQLSQGSMLTRGVSRTLGMPPDNRAAS